MGGVTHKDLLRRLAKVEAALCVDDEIQHRVWLMAMDEKGEQVGPIRKQDRDGLWVEFLEPIEFAEGTMVDLSPHAVTPDWREYE